MVADYFDHLLVDIISSSFRWLCGIFISILFGIFILIIVSLFDEEKSFLAKVFDFCRAIPILIIVPLVAFYVGPGEKSKILIVSIACLFPIIISGFNSLEKKTNDEVLFFNGLNLNRFYRWKLESWPLIRIGVADGVKIAVGIGWVSVVAAEYLGIYSDSIFSGGLGYRVQEFYKVGDISGMWFYAFLFGCMGFSSSFAVNRLKKNLISL